jgi:hypothetical protein
MKNIVKNTKEKGRFQIFSYFDKKEKTYVAVCLEFNIVLTGNNPAALANEVMFMSLTHIESVKDLDFPVDLLNRPAPKKYWDIFEEIKKTKENTIIESPYQTDLFNKACLEN